MGAASRRGGALRRSPRRSNQPGLQTWYANWPPSSPDQAGAPTVLDVFCGAGGFTCGFVAERFRPVFAVDFDASCVATYAANFGGHTRTGDVSDLLRVEP